MSRYIRRKIRLAMAQLLALSISAGLILAILIVVVFALSGGYSTL